MLSKLWDYYRQLLFSPARPDSFWQSVTEVLSLLALGLLVTLAIAFIVARIVDKTHREEVAALMRSRFAWGWAFAVCAVLQILDIAYLWYNDLLDSFAAVLPLLLNVIGLGGIGLLFYALLRAELRKVQLIIKRTSEAR